MPLVLVFLQHLLDLTCKMRIYLRKPYRNILVHGAFTYTVNLCCASYRRFVIYYIFSEYNTSFTFRIRYRYCSGFHIIAPFIRQHLLISTVHIVCSNICCKEREYDRHCKKQPKQKNRLHCFRKVGMQSFLLYN